MEADPKNICEMHDLHVWKLGGQKLSLSCHIRTHAPLKTLARVTDVCRRKFNLYHTTIQVEGLSDKSSNPHAFECDQDVHEP
jgi:Co/Zn/Cd efflux system component